MNRARMVIIISTLMAVIAIGTGFFHVVEGLSLIDSYFFTVVTISTVGYGNLVPVTVLGKIGTTVLIFGGLGVIAAAIHEFAQYHIRRRETHAEWLIGTLGTDQTTEDSLSPANADDSPKAR